MLNQYATLRVIEKILSEPNREFSVRGIAKEMNISPGTSSNSLRYLLKKGILKLRVIGRNYQYQADLENPLCRQWKMLLGLDMLTESDLMGKIMKKVPDVQSAILYGSFAKGTYDKKSDVDIILIVQNRQAYDMNFLATIKQEVNVSIFSIGDWKKLAHDNKVFYENVIYDSIILYGQRPVVH